MSNSRSLHYQLCCEGAKYIIQPRAREQEKEARIRLLEGSVIRFLIEKVRYAKGKNDE